MNSRAHKSVTQALRIPEDLKQKLDRLSEKQGLSASKIFNVALRRYLEWDVYAEKFGLITTTTSLMKGLFDYLTEEEARTLGREKGGSQFIDFVNSYFKKCDLDSVLKAFEIMRGGNGNAFIFEHSSNNGTRTMILKHDRGLHTSAYYAEMLEAIFRRLNMETKIVETEDQVSATVKSHDTVTTQKPFPVLATEN